MNKEVWIEDMKNAMSMIENACSMLIWNNEKREDNFEICEEKCPFFKACEALRKGSDYKYDYAEIDLLTVFGK